MMKMEQNKKLKRQKIIKAAQNVFRVGGFISSSMDRIAEEANVTKQTLYRYFDSKEDLFKAAIEAQRLEADSNFLDALDLEDSKEALKRFAIGFIAWHLSREHLANVRLLIAEGPSVPEITRHFYALGPNKMKTKLCQFVKDRFGIDHADFEIDVFTNTLISMRMPVLTGLNPPPSQPEIHLQAEKTINLFMKLLDFKKE